MSAGPQTEPLVRFCGYCGRPPSGPYRRVCGCGRGVILEAKVEEAPRPNDAFLVVGPMLTIAAVSRRAEQLLKVKEEDFVNRPLTRLLVPADGTSPHALEADVEKVAGGTGPGARAFRQVDALTRKLAARLGHCGTPSAALVVLTDTD